MNNFSEVVRKAMVSLEMKPAELARRTGYSKQHISDLLKGERRWNEDSISKVCKALGLQIDYHVPDNNEQLTTEDSREVT